VSAAKHSCYACEIKEATNGGRRGARGQAREAIEVVPARRISRDVQIDESKRTAQNGQDEAQKIADPKT